MKTALVAGAGGFIGHHMVKYLKADGYRVRGVDIKRPEYEPSDADEFVVLDLRDARGLLQATRGWRRCTSSRPTWAGSATSPRSTPTSPGTTS